jgi:alpha-glucosidase
MNALETCPCYRLLVALIASLLVLPGCKRSEPEGSPDAGPAETDAGTDADAGIEADAGHALLPLCETGKLPDWASRSASGGFRLGCGEQVLDLAVWNQGTVRLRYGAAAPRHSAAVVGTPDQGLEPSFGGDDEQVAICSSELSVTVSRDCRVTVADRTGKVLLEDGADGGYFEDGTSRGVRRALVQGERFYGFGEKGGPFDKRGQVMEMWGSDPFVEEWGGYPPGTDPLYQSIPFFIGLRGGTAYGLFTDNSYRTRFDMGSTDRFHYAVSAEGGDIDQYLIAGPSMAEVLRRYTGLTGRMPLPPRWSLGFHQSRWGWYPDSEIRSIASELRSRRLPADGLWLDIQHMDGFRSFTWDHNGFPDPAGLVSDLAAQGFKLTLIIDPGIKVDPGWDVYESGLAGGFYLGTSDGQPHVGEVWPGQAVFPDFTASATRSWWGSLIQRHTGIGARGLWIDMNEPTSFNEPGKTVPSTLVANGDGEPTTMAEAHNLYALYEAKATWEGMRADAPTKRPFVLTRAGYAGIQRYSAVWTGDAPSRWETLNETVPMLLNLGLSGVTFSGSDVGGYGGTATPELFARWMEFGALSPFFRAHCQTSGNRQEPWAFGTEVEDISRAMLQERYELMPYIYSLFHEATRSGAPVLRPLVYEWQSDERTYSIGDEAMLGPWLLYAPVLQEGAQKRLIYLPAGRWFELYSGAVREGPVTFEQPVVLGARPAFVREGAIIPRVDFSQWTDERIPSVLRLDLYPSQTPSSFDFYEDEGDGFGYEQNGGSLVTYTLQRDATGATLQASQRQGNYQPPARTLIARFRRVDHLPSRVTLDDQPLTSAGSEDALLAAGRGYWWDDRDLSLVVAFPERAGFRLRADYDPALSEASSAVQVRFEVKVPAGTPTDQPITIATSANGWQHQPLEWIGSDTAAGLVSLPRGEWFFYKFARGSWDTVEKWDSCQEASNRYGFAAAHPDRSDTVATWADWCH